MKQDIKIMLPFYRIIYPILYVILMAFVRGISDTREIGIVLDSMIPVLAIVFMSDTYHIEYREQRWEIIALFSLKKLNQMIYKRVWIQIIYLMLVNGLGYWFFYIQKPIKQGLNKELNLYFSFLFACVITIAFFGMISLIVANTFNNMWIGIGVSLVCWLSLNSTTGNKILGVINVLAYAFRKFENANDYHWVIGKIFAVLCVVIMFFLLPRTIKNRR